MTAETKTNKNDAVSAFFKQNPLINTIYVDNQGNIYVSYNAKKNLKKIIRK
jgi:hypothetical protein